MKTFVFDGFYGSWYIFFLPRLVGQFCASSKWSQKSMEEPSGKSIFRTEKAHTAHTQKMIPLKVKPNPRNEKGP